MSASRPICSGFQPSSFCVRALELGTSTPAPLVQVRHSDNLLLVAAVENLWEAELQLRGEAAMSSKALGGDGHPWPWAKHGDDDPIPWAKALGDEDAYPLRQKINDAVIAKWTAGLGNYKASQIGPLVEIVATGVVNNFNTQVKLAQTP